MTTADICDLKPKAEALLLASNISKQYKMMDAKNDEWLTIIEQVNIAIEPGDTIGITGASGSGKSTLLSILAGLEPPSTGEVILNNIRLHRLTEDEKAQLRLQTIGFIFQSFQLIPTLTAFQNVTVPLKLQAMQHLINKEQQAEIDASAIDLLTQLGLASRLHHLPSQLSGGEQQRVAIARATIHKPKILFADEPTGNLDRRRSAQIAEWLFTDTLWPDHKPAIVMVTHDHSIASCCHKQYEMIDGTLIS